MPKLAYDAMLLPGETLAYRIEGAYDISSSNSTIGTLYITSFQLFFVDALDQRTSHIPLGCIGSIKKPKGGHHTHNIPITDKSQYLEIRGKDLRRLKYILPLGACKPAEVRRYLELASSPEHFNDTFAFFYSPNIEALDSGWEIYNPLEEFRRIGLIGNGWRVTEINANFAISKTYPEVLVVPETITDKQLEKVAEFRSKGRIPACVWKHKTNTATISRCSQPMVGLGRVRCEEDEALFREIHRANNGGKALYIVDARPKVNAAACNLSGGGTENVSNYTESRALLEYSGIANIHVVRDALKRLAKACEDQKTKDVGAHWFGHLASILAATRRIVSYIEDEGCSVVTHCTDGWDRTSQLCALSEMLLDPYYRTIKGFLVVICKEFLSFGHKFNTRNGNIANLPRSQRAPIFVQFLDCVWQLTRQFPTSFEFSEHLLLLIATHLHTHVFGTFLGDCELERRDATLRTETASLWGLVLRAPPALAALLTNPMYTPSQSVLRVNANTQSMQLWREYHARWAKKAAENGKANGDKGTVKDNKGKGAGEKGHENGHGGENGKGAENGKDGDDGLHKVDPTLLHETMLVPFLDTLPQADQDNIRKELKEWLSMGGGKPRQSVRMSLSPASLPPLPIEHESPSSYNTVHPQHKKGKEKSLEDVDWDSAEEGRPRAKSLSPTENGKSEPVGKLNGVGKGRDGSEEEKEKEKNQENQQQGTTTTTPTTTTTNEGGTPSTPSGSTLNISPSSGSTLNISKPNGSTLNINSSSGSTLNLAQQNNPNTSTNTLENKEHKEEPTNPENPPNNSHDTNVNNNHSDNDNNHNVNSTGAATETSTENSNTS